MPGETFAVDARTIEQALNTRWLGRSFHVFRSVSSTNTVLGQLAEEGAPAGTMVVADFQSQGRGRRQRRWHAPPGSSLLLSLLFRPQWPAVQAHWLTMIAGLAAVAAIEARTELQAGLKWPNDVMLRAVAGDGLQWRKTGGILLETRLEGGVIRQAIVGMGLNVNVDLEALPVSDTPAGSLLAATGRRLDRVALLAHILQRLEALYEEAAAGASPQQAWESRLITRNQKVRVTTDEEVVEGLALGCDEWGRLLVRLKDGKVRRFAAGDVTLRETV